jgi:putative membrane protein
MKDIIIGILLFLFAFFPVNFIEIKIEFVSIISIIIFAIPSYYFFIKNSKNKKTQNKAIFTIIAISIFAVVIETIGIITGFPYSPFFYGDYIGFKIFDLTPFTILFTFTPLVLGSTFLANKYKKQLSEKIKFIKLNEKIIFIFLSVLFLVITDLLLDPVAVYLGFWTWINPGIYYGIPLMNYFGWVFSGLIASVIYYYFMKNNTFSGQEKSLFYSTCFWCGAAFFTGYYIPLIFGLIILYLLKK